MLVEGGIEKNIYRQKIKNELGKMFNMVSGLNPINAYLTTKYSPLPLNARLYLRSKMYPNWNFTNKDFRKNELAILYDLAQLASIRQNTWEDRGAFPVEKSVILNPNKYKDDSMYKIKEWGDEIISGKDLKEMAKDYMSDGIAFHDYYDGLMSMYDYHKDKNGNIIKKRRYSDKQIRQMDNFPRDNKFMRAYHSFTNPVYAVRTGIGRANIIPLGEKYRDGSRGQYILNDTFDFEKINRDDYDMNDDYYKLHKEAENKSFPIKVNVDLGF